MASKLTQTTIFRCMYISIGYLKTIKTKRKLTLTIGRHLSFLVSCVGVRKV